MASRRLEEVLPPGRVFGPGAHFAGYLDEIFPAVRGVTLEAGVLTVESGVPLAAISLVESDEAGVSFPQDLYRVTAYPVIPGRPDSGM
jgi:hypothetical protein